MAVSIILDIIIILIAVFTLIISYKKGFLRTLIDTLSFFLAIVIALMFLNPVKSLIYKTAIDEKILTETHSELDSAVGNSDIGDVIDGMSEDPAKQTSEETTIIDNFKKFLEKFGIDTQAITDEYNQLVKQGSTNIRNGIIDYVAKPITNAVITVIAFLILFVLSLIVIRLAARLLDLATRLPVINGINKFMSIPLGIVLALFRIFCFCAIVQLLLPYSSTLHLSALNQAAVSSTFIFKFFYNNNVIVKIFS